MYRMSVTGEIVRGIVLFVVLEAVILFLDVIVPPSMPGRVVFGLIFFALEVFVIPVGWLIFTVSQVQRARQSQRYHRLPLPELQRGGPEQPAAKPAVPRTIFGPETELWFEALFDRTLEEPPSTTAHAILTRHYVTLLGGLRDHLVEHWPEPPPPDDDGQVTYAGPTDDVRALSATLRWLGQLAKNRAFKLDLLQAVRKRGIETGRETVDVAAGGPPWDEKVFEELQIEQAVRTTCTPARLELEIARLSGSEPEPAQQEAMKVSGAADG